ncbi:cysteine-rich receptor-like protein kinase, partial [Trifolium medium]|nr:cysteine-rich receptor-like protein kinase [Trifolium medium]
EGNRPLDHIPFNRFIEDNILIDLPLSGRKFTWFKGDDLSMSRLDSKRGRLESPSLEDA